VKEFAQSKKKLEQQTLKKNEILGSQDQIKDSLKKAMAKLTQSDIALKFMDPREFKVGERLKRAQVADIVEYSTTVKGI